MRDASRLSRHAARERAVRDCSLEAMVERYVDLYRELAATAALT
jgi:hypothetical protein